MARCLTALRSQVESALARRIPVSFTSCDSKVVETVSTGIPEADGLTGVAARRYHRDLWSELFRPNEFTDVSFSFSNRCRRNVRFH